jgi:hypothetical protein
MKAALSVFHGILILLFLCVANDSSAQDSTVVTAPVPVTAVKIKQQHPHHLAFRAQIGIQQAAFMEAGVTRYTYYDVAFIHPRRSQYLGIEWVPGLLTSTGTNVYGLKLGYGWDIKFLSAAVEGKYQTDGTLNDVVITPKAGIHLGRLVNLYYGYNWSLHNSPFHSVGNNQVTMAATFYKFLRGLK